MRIRTIYRTFLGVGLALGIGFAGAQTINKALQLSQDSQGAFGVDTTNNVYFPGHILNTGNAQAASTTVAADVGSPTVTGSDVAGVIVMGTSATGVNLVFGRAYATTPTCLVSWQGNQSTATPMAYSPAATAIHITQGSTSSNKVAYICTSSS